jgi:hypothetical protein
MSACSRTAAVGMTAMALAFATASGALARGGGGGGHIGGGGGHVSGFGGFSGGHISSFSGGHVGTWNGHVGSAWNGHVGNAWNGHVASNFVHHDGAWNLGHPWDHGFWHGDHFHHHFVGGFWPWYGSVWWPGYYGYYRGYPYSYYGDYYGGYPNGVDFGDYAYTETPDVNEYPEPSNAGEQTMPPEAANEEPSDSEYYTEALAAFRDGDYANAIRLASHASIDQPRDVDVHTLLMLGMFAVGQYRGGAMEGHAVATLGKVPNWPTIFAIYGNVDTYTRQLRALEKYTVKNPAAPEGRFLLGVQYAITGHNEAAQSEFLAALKATPRDRVAAQLLTMEGGTVPADIAQLQKEKPPTITK